MKFTSELGWNRATGGFALRAGLYPQTKTDDATKSHRLDLAPAT